MACDLTAGRAFPCKDGIGGIKDVIFIEHEDSAFGAVSAGAISDTTAAMTAWRYELQKNTGSFVQNFPDTIAGGGIHYQQQLTIMFPKLEAAVSAELDSLLRRRVTIIIRDSNDNFHIMGLNDGCEVTGGNIGSGTAKGDFQGYTVTWTAEEAIPAPYFIDMTSSTARGLLTGAITLSPDYY